MIHWNRRLFPQIWKKVNPSWLFTASLPLGGHSRNGAAFSVAPLSMFHEIASLRP